MSQLRLSYVLPLAWEDDTELAELVAYLGELRELVDEVIVVDGSSPHVFERHAAALQPGCRHLRPDPALRFRMGKVIGVITGVEAAENEAVVIADDDVRWDAAGLARVRELLAEAELVRPQNYFSALPWHARWDTARTLLNRVFSGDLDDPRADFPGTLAVRRSAFRATGGYDGDVIFENLELIRTVRAAGGRVASPPDLYVARRPPSSRHFLSQRVRQAYDDLAIPLRLAWELAAAPALLVAFAQRRFSALAAAAAGLIALAELGRRRAGGGAVFPLSASLFAPAWMLERALFVWVAIAQRLVWGGVRYRGETIRTAAHSVRELRVRYESPSGEGDSTGEATVAGEGSSTGALAARKPISL